MDLKTNTKKYITAFNCKNIEAISEMLLPDSQLFDPANSGGLFEKESIVQMLQKLFNNTKELSFVAKNIFAEGNNSIIEFSLQIDDQKLCGVDIIEWNLDGKIVKLRAYLY